MEPALFRLSRGIRLIAVRNMYKERLMIPQHHETFLEVIQANARFAAQPFRQQPSRRIGAGPDAQRSTATKSRIHLDDTNPLFRCQNKLDRNQANATAQSSSYPHAGLHDAFMLDRLGFRDLAPSNFDSSTGNHATGFSPVSRINIKRMFNSRYKLLNQTIRHQGRERSPIMPVADYEIALTGTSETWLGEVGKLISPDPSDLRQCPCLRSIDLVPSQKLEHFELVPTCSYHLRRRDHNSAFEPGKLISGIRQR